MPNHVHLILSPFEGVQLHDIVRTLKTFSANKINKALDRQGQLWFCEYFDRFIRNADHLERTCHYVEWYPVKARLATDPKHWEWSSACESSISRLETISQAPWPHRK